MQMSEEKKQTSGFKIKWADREIEYYGDNAPDVFKTVFEYVKSAPITNVPSVPPSTQPPTQPLTQPPTQEAMKPPTSTVEGDVYERIMKDAEVTKEQVLSAIKFEKRAGFSESIPCLPSHPHVRDAVVLVSYALQLGFQRTLIEVADLKKILREDGYPLLGSELGLILRDFRRDNVTITSQTKGQYKPFSLANKGLDRARNLLKTGSK